MPKSMLFKDDAADEALALLEEQRQERQRAEEAPLFARLDAAVAPFLQSMANQRQGAGAASWATLQAEGWFELLPLLGSHRVGELES